MISTSEKQVFILSFSAENSYICNMKKIQKDNVLLVADRSKERNFILNSMIASFRLEGIFIPEKRVEVIYAKVNEKLKK